MNPQGRPYAWWRLHDQYEADEDPWNGQIEEKIRLSREDGEKSAGRA